MRTLHGCVGLLAISVALLAGCGSAPHAASGPTTTSGPPTPVPSLGVKYGAALGAVPHAFLQFSNAAGRDHDPDGDLLYRQAAPVISALRDLDTALAGGSAPRRIADDMARLVLDDERLLADLQELPGLAGTQLSAWEQGFSADGKTEQIVFDDVLYDFGLPSVGQG